jgi:double-strand break repair protein MRE11
MEAENTLRVLVATDIHLGCHEKDPIRCDDSIATFREILAYARDRQACTINLAIIPLY